MSFDFGARLAAALRSAHTAASMAALEHGLALMVTANRVVSEGMASQRTLVPTRQDLITLSSTSAADVLPFICCRDLCEDAVVFAANWQPVGKTVWLNVRKFGFALLSSDDGKDFAPKLRTGVPEKLAVTKHVEAALSARQGDAHTVLDAEEADRFVAVAADQRQDDDLVLFSLVGIDRDNVEASLVKYDGVSECAENALALAVVECEDGDVVCLHAVVDEVLHETNDHGGFVSVDARHLLISLLLPSVRKEERVDASHARHIRAVGGHKNARMVFDGAMVDWCQ